MVAILGVGGELQCEQSDELVLKIRDRFLEYHNSAKPLASTGAFICSIIPKAPKTAPNTWHPSPTAKMDFESLLPPKATQMFSPTAKPGISLLQVY